MYLYSLDHSHAVFIWTFHKFINIPLKLKLILIWFSVCSCLAQISPDWGRKTKPKHGKKHLLHTTMGFASQNSACHHWMEEFTLENCCCCWFIATFNKWMTTDVKYHCILGHMMVLVCMYWWVIFRWTFVMCSHALTVKLISFAYCLKNWIPQ